LDHAVLVELCVQLATTYVLEGLPAQATAASACALAGDEPFASLLRRLKSERPNDPILERFVINGEHVPVKTAQGHVDLTEYRRPTPSPPPPAAAAARPT